MSSLEDKMGIQREKFRAHFDLFEIDSMNPEEFKQWNAAFVTGFFDYQTAKSAFILGKKAIHEAKNVVKK